MINQSVASAPSTAPESRSGLPVTAKDAGKKGVGPRVEGGPRSPGSASKAPVRFGVVDIGCEPASCTVTLDGKRLGETPLLNQRIPEGAHTAVLVDTESGVSQTRSFEVQPSKRTKVLVSF
jgi:hypothetical protein